MALSWCVSGLFPASVQWRAVPRWSHVMLGFGTVRGGAVVGWGASGCRVLDGMRAQGVSIHFVISGGCASGGCSVMRVVSGSCCTGTPPTLGRAGALSEHRPRPDVPSWCRRVLVVIVFGCEIFGDAGTEHTVVVSISATIDDARYSTLPTRGYCANPRCCFRGVFY